jgi:hypothetical protein
MTARALFFDPQRNENAAIVVQCGRKASVPKCLLVRQIVSEWKKCNERAQYAKKIRNTNHKAARIGTWDGTRRIKPLQRTMNTRSPPERWPLIYAGRIAELCLRDTKKTGVINPMELSWVTMLFSGDGNSSIFPISRFILFETSNCRLHKIPRNLLPLSSDH